MANEGGIDVQIERSKDVFRGDLVNYSEFPSSFRLEPGVVDAINLLRGTIYPSAQEFGAILTKTHNGELKPVLVGKPGEGVVEVRHLTLDEEWLSQIEAGQAQQFEESSKSTPHIVFASKAMAEQHPDTFTKFVEAGIQVRLDVTPQAILHTHPSGNLPSGGDMSKVLYNFHGDRLIEGVITKTETFFLIPSKQTPDLFSSDQYRFPLTFTEEMEKREDDIVGQLSTQRKSPTGALNAARYELLRQACTTYDIGLYVVYGNAAVAVRIF